MYVVNCSQKLISLIFGTTCLELMKDLPGCELLSKVDIFDIRNNLKKQSYENNKVVNCSQKLISLIFGTTNAGIETVNVRLWIALKSWYLWYSEQLNTYGQKTYTSCELLSKVDIFDIRNNIVTQSGFPDLVVNCSQKLISLIFGTTTSCAWIHSVVLWIALKSWYLWYSEQLLPNEHHHIVRCELLSKVDIFDIRNNYPFHWWARTPLWIALKSWYLWYSEQPPVRIILSVSVVNCSQKLISLIFGTTSK